MAKKITYLLGAGASANAIPVVAGMHERMKEVIGYFQQSNYYTVLENVLGTKIETPSTALKPILRDIIKELTWLIDQAGEYYTIDTLAKKYYLTNDDKYYRLKNVLILYFTLEQFLFIPSKKQNGYNFEKENLDKRYSSLIAAIAKKTKAGLQLNNNVQMLSWNYDQQFELSLQSFLNRRIHEIKEDYNIHPNSISYWAQDKQAIIKENDFCLIKLNGNAAWDTIAEKKPMDKKDIRHTLFDKGIIANEKLEKFIQYYQTYKDTLDGHRQYFNFSWEAADNEYDDNYNGYRNMILEAEKIAKNTEILVVIGYSFPIFNRAVDNKLFSKMDNLEKIYIQDKNPTKIRSTMENAFKILQIPYTPESDLANGKQYKVEIFEEPYTDQFVIPYELNQD